MRPRHLAALAALTLLLAPPASAVPSATPTPAPWQIPNWYPVARVGAWHQVPLCGDLVRIYDAPNDPYAAGHRGVDVGGLTGAPVRASAGGIVTFAGLVVDNRTVTIDHGGGLTTTYSYLGSITIANGQSVAQGRQIGTVGAGHPGSGFGPHVHLAARRGGVYFDPLELYVGISHSDLISLVG